MQIEWLTKVVRAGMESGEFSSHAEPSDIALMIINVCERLKRSGACNARPEVFANSLKYIKLLLNTPIQENDTMLDWNNYRSELMQRLGELGKLDPETMKGVVAGQRR